VTIDKIIEDVLKKEGRFVDHPDDRGGPTNWGITQDVARECGYTADMRDLPRGAAKAIYYEQYVKAPMFDRVAEIAPKIGAELVDTGVNMGPAVAATMLQRALNVLNSKGLHYPDVAADGRVGLKTLAALRAFLRRRGAEGEIVLLKTLNCLQGARYVEITERREANESFFYGWIRERVGL
jgi:lysozyme family protein